MWELTSSLLNLLGIIMVIVGIILLVFAQPLIKMVISKNLSPEQLHNAVIIMRLIALNPLLFTISGILTSLQQTFGRFFFYALAPIFYNTCIIVSIYIFKNNIGLTGLGIGALTGAILQLSIVLPVSVGMNFKYHLKSTCVIMTSAECCGLIPPRSLDQGIDSINSIVETNRAATLGVGNITYYEKRSYASYGTYITYRYYDRNRGLSAPK